MSAASGLVEVIATLLQMREGFLHPNVGLDEPDPRLAVSVIGPYAIERKVSRALSNACGGGGLNTSVVITAPLEKQRNRTSLAEPKREIIITGVGTVSTLGAGTAEVFALECETPTNVSGFLNWFDISEWYPVETNYSRLSRAGQLAAAAGAIAIRDARWRETYASDRIAVLSGTLLGGAPEASAVLCAALAEDPNAIRPSMALDHGVHLGAALVRRYFGYNGITYTFTGSSLAGLQASIIARDLMTCGRADAAVILGHDALDDPLLRAAPWLKDCMPTDNLGEGAGAVVLECGDATFEYPTNRQTLIRESVMLAGFRPSREALNRIASQLAAALRYHDWDVIYLSGPVGAELEDMTECLLRHTSCSAELQRLQAKAKYCMAADPMFALAAAVASNKRALVLAAEQGGSVAGLSVAPRKTV